MKETPIDVSDDELIDRVLEGWAPMDPPPGFAERVLAAHRGRATRRPRVISGWRLAAATGIFALVAALTLGLLQPSSGEKVASFRQTIELGRRGLAVAEAGAQVSWNVSPMGNAGVSQTAGDVFYRVDRGGPFVVSTPLVDAIVTGTCFRVEVFEMERTKEKLGAALVGAIGASAVLVTVYEGSVRLRAGTEPGQVIDVKAGEQARVGSPPRADLRSIPAGGVSIAASPTPSAFLAETTAQKARIADLEREIAKLKSLKVPAAAERAAFDKVRGFTSDELKDLAKKCELRMGYPEYGLIAPTLDPDTASSLQVPDSEQEQINAILAAQNQQFLATMRSLYLALTGDAKGADTLDVRAMVEEITAKSRPQQLQAAQQEISRERAGLASVPSDPTSEPPVSGLYRLLSGSGDALQSALAASLGDAEAQRLLAALTPVHRAVQGCPESK